MPGTEIDMYAKEAAATPATYTAMLFRTFLIPCRIIRPPFICPRLVSPLYTRLQVY